VTGDIVQCVGSVLFYPSIQLGYLAIWNDPLMADVPWERVFGFDRKVRSTSFAFRLCITRTELDGILDLWTIDLHLIILEIGHCD